MYKLGQGGFASVYKTSDGCAAKLVRKADLTDNPNLQKQLKSEIDIHRNL